MITNDNYSKYKGDFKKLNVYSIMVAAISITLILFFIFLPVFQYSQRRELTDREKLECIFLSEDELVKKYGLYTDEAKQDFIDNGIITEHVNFSIFNSFMEDVQAITNKNSGSQSFTIVLFVYTLVEIAYSLFIFGASLKDLLTFSLGFNNDSYLLRYNKIKKSGEEKEKKSFFQKTSIFNLFYLVIFDVLFSKYLFSIGDFNSHLLTKVSGVSFLIVFPILFLISFFVIKLLKVKANKKLLLKITKEDGDVSDKITASSL